MNNSDTLYFVRICLCTLRFAMDPLAYPQGIWRCYGASAIDLRDVSMLALRRQIGLVTQSQGFSKPWIFFVFSSKHIFDGLGKINVKPRDLPIIFWHFPHNPPPHISNWLLSCGFPKIDPGVAYSWGLLILEFADFSRFYAVSKAFLYVIQSGVACILELLMFGCQQRIDQRVAHIRGSFIKGGMSKQVALAQMEYSHVFFF